LERMIIQIADRNIQQSYRQILKDKIYKSFRTNNAYKGKKNQMPQVKLSRPSANQDLPSRLILGMIIHHPHLYDHYEEKLAGFGCANQSLDVLRQHVISILSDTSDITHDDLKIALENKGINGEQMISLTRDMKLHASYVFDEDAGEAIETGLNELLKRVAV